MNSKSYKEMNLEELFEELSNNDFLEKDVEICKEIKKIVINLTPEQIKNILHVIANDYYNIIESYDLGYDEGFRVGFVEAHDIEV